MDHTQYAIVAGAIVNFDDGCAGDCHCESCEQRDKLKLGYPRSHAKALAWAKNTWKVRGLVQAGVGVGGGRCFSESDLIHYAGQTVVLGVDQARDEKGRWAAAAGAAAGAALEHLRQASNLIASNRDSFKTVNSAASRKVHRLASDAGLHIMNAAGRAKTASSYSLKKAAEAVDTLTSTPPNHPDRVTARADRDGLLNDQRAAKRAADQAATSLKGLAQRGHAWAVEAHKHVKAAQEKLSEAESIAQKGMGM